MGKLRSLALILFVAVLIAACGSGGGGGGTNDNPGSSSDTTKPTISQTSPANGATGVAINSSIAVTFSEAMDSSTINGTTFTLSDGSNTVSGTVTCNGTTATFTPSSNLGFNTTYTAMITTGATDSAGNAVDSNYSWTFTTESQTDAMAITTADATNITDTSATLNGSFNNLTGDTTTVWFEYGITTSYGSSSISTAYTTAGGTRNKHRTPLVSVKILGKTGMSEISRWLKEFMRS